MPNDTKLPAPPYVAFKSLTNFLDWLAEVGVPDRIDRSFWGQKWSGGYGAQIMAALRFFGLMTDEDSPRPELETMANDVAERKRLLASIIVDRYGEVLDGLDLERATAGQLTERFRRYDVAGETFRKCVMFFVHAAQYCGIPLSSHISQRGRVRKATGSGSASRKQPKAKNRPHQEVPPKTEALNTPAEVEDLGLHPTVETLLRDLNRRGAEWDVVERQRWLDTFTAVMDYAYPPKE